MISFVVPAYNEEAFVGQTLRTIRESAETLGEAYEIIVCDDSSSDRTAEIAETLGARVVRVNHRQIAATRNAGAHASTGEFIFFIDADTTISARTLAAALKQLRGGAVGGGGLTWFDSSERLPAFVRPGFVLMSAMVLLTGSVTGCFMYCTRAAFEATGGFPEDMYWAEEAPFASALKREGRFAVVWPPVIISGRRYRRLGKQNSFTRWGSVFAAPRKLFTDRAVVQNVWYDPVRSDLNLVPSALGERIGHFSWLLLIVLAYVGIVWSFLPWTPAPWPGALGSIRDGVTVLLAHLGLIFWPMAVSTLVNVLRQKRPTNLLRSFLTIAIFGWLGWTSLRTLGQTYAPLWQTLA